MGMSNPLVRWWVVFSITLIALGTALAAGAAELIANSDKTGISWGILAIFIMASVYLGRKATIVGEGPRMGGSKFAAERVSENVKYWSEQCTALGFLGTVIGLIITTRTFIDVDIGNTESMKDALTTIAGGVGTALVTTLTGLISAILLRFQLKVVK
jgi:hypothetical protein